MEKEKEIFQSVGEVNFLTPENCSFKVSENGFLSASIDGRDFVRVYLYRVFPHDMRDEFITVADADKNEYGIIRRLADFGHDVYEILLKDVEKRYFIPRILEIPSVEERFGNSYWTVETDIGKRTFTVRDTYKSIIRIGEDRAIVLDEDSNRYEIVSLKALDKKSFRRIELFL